MSDICKIKLGDGRKPVKRCGKNTARKVGVEKLEDDTGYISESEMNSKYFFFFKRIIIPDLKNFF